MKNLAIKPNGNVISSRQIAEATDKRHDHVMRDIRFLLDRGAINVIISEDSNLRDENADKTSESVCATLVGTTDPICPDLLRAG